MDRFVALLNIEHYEDMLAKEKPESERHRQLTQLLLEERAKLLKAEREHNPDRQRDL